MHLLVAIEGEGSVQGLMALLRIPQIGLLSDDKVLYVDYLETAPWNLKDYTATPRFLGIGTRLIAEAINISLEAGLEGRVSLHSLPQAKAFYAKCGFRKLGHDAGYFDLRYFEYTSASARGFLRSIGDMG